MSEKVTAVEPSLLVGEVHTHNGILLARASRIVRAVANMPMHEVHMPTLLGIDRITFKRPSDDVLFVRRRGLYDMHYDHEVDTWYKFKKYENGIGLTTYFDPRKEEVIDEEHLMDRNIQGASRDVITERWQGIVSTRQSLLETGQLDPLNEYELHVFSGLLDKICVLTGVAR